ncbi:MAG: hypothetical protein ABIT83_07940 [Massilia sp.]
MSAIAAPITRTTPSPALRTAAQDNSQSALAQAASASGKQAARLPVVDPLAPAAASVSLSQQALDARVDQLGRKTVDVAQKFIGQFADALFGKAAKGATVQFDSVSLSADASLSSSVTHFDNADGSIDSASLDFSANAHFIGRGTIVTEDGQSYDFEIEVKYEASVQASAARTTSVAADKDDTTASTTSDLGALTGKNLPQIKFPGSLADLFKVLGRELQGKTDAGNEQGDSGNLSLRLLRLVNSAALLAPRQPADQPAPTAVDRSKALAAYAPAPAPAVAAASTDVATA